MKHFLTLATALAVTGGAATAQGFDPRHGCAEAIEGADAASQTMIAAWTFGYLAAATQGVRPVDASNNEVVLRNLAAACQANPQASLLDLVSGSAAPAPESTEVTPGSKADAERVLAQFMQPGADYLALTQALLPTEAQVRAVYAEPLATALWQNYAEQMGPGVSFQPKPGQSEVLVVHTTTRALFDRQPVLGEFPGGYKDVLPYFKIDVPIVRFKFVEPGKDTGLAFDGLIFLDGQWVLMPKPWRALPS